MSLILSKVLEYCAYDEHNEMISVRLVETMNKSAREDEYNPLYTIEISRESKRFGGATVDINLKAQDKKIAIDLFNLLKKAEITFDKY